jgi:Zn-dependent metalloprotease
MTLMKWLPNCNFLRSFKRLDHLEQTPDPGTKVMTKDAPFYSITDIHDNLGIGNHAFYLAAKAFGGNSWETMVQIWYQSLTSSEFKNPSKKNYKGWRDITISYAKTVAQNKCAKIMADAWKAVGL